MKRQLSTRKVYTFEEYQKLRRQNRLPVMGDQYMVKYTRDGSSPVEVELYVTTGKDRHDDVEKRWKEDFIGYQLYRVSYC